MGKQKQMVKERVCWTCKGKFNMTAKQIKAHGQLCARAARVGLVLARG